MSPEKQKKGFIDTVADLIGPDFAHLIDRRRPRDEVCYEALSAFLRSFVLERTDEHFFIRCPSVVHASDRVASAFARHPLAPAWRFTDHGNAWSLERRESAAGDPSSDRFLVELFAELNGMPSYADIELSSYAPASSPRLSCVIALTFNDLFCLNHTIPSIIANSVGTPIEIVVVHNGLGVDVEGLLRRIQGVHFVYSEFLSIPCAYNRGVAEARGDYVALFHDDCLLGDPQWIEKCFAALGGDCIAASAELAQHAKIGAVPKAVPMVLRKRDYEDIGGLDERLWGSEDIELALRMKSRGKTFAPVELTSFHFGGMSAAMLFARDPALLRSLFAHPILTRHYANALGNVSTLLAFKFPLAKVITDACMYYITRRYARELDPDDPPEKITVPELRSPLDSLVELFHMHSGFPEAARDSESKRRAFQELLSARRQGVPRPAGGR